MKSDRIHLRRIQHSPPLSERQQSDQRDINSNNRPAASIIFDPSQPIFSQIPRFSPYKNGVGAFPVHGTFLTLRAAAQRVQLPGQTTSANPSGIYLIPELYSGFPFNRILS